MMKAALLLGFTLILIGVKTVSAQTNITNDYVIIATGNVSDQTPYVTALDAANWETFRLQDQRFKMSFDNGFTIELKSASELITLGNSLNLTFYAVEKPQGYMAPTLKLLPGNIIGMEIQPSIHPKYH